MLCDLLTSSGAAGQPESYFRPASIAGYADRWGIDLTDGAWGRSYVEAVRVHGAAGTDCVGVRIMWSDMPEVLAHLADLYPGRASDRDRLRSQLGIEHFVRLSRSDKVAQAVSLVMAIQSGLWHRNADGTVREGAALVKPVRYNHEMIAAELALLEAESEGWDRWFATQAIAPLELDYDVLGLEPVVQMKRVLEHIGRSAERSPVVRTAKLATTRNDEWVERFRGEIGDD